MSLTVSSQHLIDTAKVFDGLANHIGKLPQLRADAVAAKLTGCAIGDALAHTDAASLRAKSVMEGRFQEISGLLTHSANEYTKADKTHADAIAAAVACRLDSLGDLNSGDPHSGT